MVTGKSLKVLHSCTGLWVCFTCNSYPKIEFYHTDGVRTMMVDILFIFAKLKPETSYRQVVGQVIFQLTYSSYPANVAVPDL